MEDHRATHAVSSKLHEANIANARRNNPAKILQVVDELSCKISLYQTFLVDIKGKNIWEKYKNSFFINFNYEFSFLMEKRSKIDDDDDDDDDDDELFL